MSENKFDEIPDIFEFSEAELAQAPPVSAEFQSQLDKWAQQGYHVSVAKGKNTNVFVDDGDVTTIFDANGNLMRSTGR